MSTKERSADVLLFEQHVSGNGVMIPCRLIRPNSHQPRQDFDEAEMEQLRLSIETNGQKEPIEVYCIDDGLGHFFEIDDGERRWRVTNRRLKREEIWALIILNERTPDQIFDDALIKNVCRSGYTPRDIVRNIRRLKERGLTNAEIAARFGYTEQWIYRYLPLLDFSEELLALMDPHRAFKSRLKLPVAAMLADIPNPEKRMLFAQYICLNGLSVSAAKSFILREARKLGHKVGTEKSSPNREYNKLRSWSIASKERMEAIVEIPGDRFKAMFVSRLDHELDSIVQDLDAIGGDINMIRDAINKIRHEKCRTGC